MRVGDIVQTLYSKSPMVVLSVRSDGEGTAGHLRYLAKGPEWGAVRAGDISQIGKLPPYTGELTDEEQALAMRLILIGE